MAYLRAYLNDVGYDYRRWPPHNPNDIIVQSPNFEAAMGQVLIRNIDDDVLECLKRRATARQQSLEQCLRDVLAEAVKPNREELLAEVERVRTAIASRNAGKSFPTAEELIREGRDSR